MRGTKGRTRFLSALLAAAASTVAYAQAPDGRALAERLRPHALSAATAAVAAPDRLEVLAYRFGGGPAVGGSRLAFETVAVRGPNQSGVVQLRFRITEDGAPRGEARASVRGIVRGPALVARRTLVRGKPISPQQLEIRDVELTRLQAPPLRAVEQVADLVPLRTLAAGRPLTAELLVPAPAVRRGDVVELRVEQRGLRVATRARALRDGVAGETIPAENARSGAVVTAEVLADGSLRVVAGPGRGAPR